MLKPLHVLRLSNVTDNCPKAWLRIDGQVKLPVLLLLSLLTAHDKPTHLTDRITDSHHFQTRFSVVSITDTCKAVAAVAQPGCCTWQQ
jgi:hypothetical protein